MNWFLCKVSFDKIQEDGLMKKVTEPYLVDALSFTEAEERICKEVRPYASGEFTVSKISRSHIAELLCNEDGDKWYKAKVNLLALDENKGTEKRVPQTYMVQASDINDALGRLNKEMDSMLGDMVVENIAETQILDVYPYEAQ